MQTTPHQVLFKCDETRPRCDKCRASARECVFLIAPKDHTASLASSISKSLQSTVLSFLDDSPRGSCEVVTSPPVFTLHIELFHYFCTETVKTLEASSQGATVPLPVIVTHCLSTPYLMNELLAFAALHLSIVRPMQREYYHRHAMQLQTHAINDLKDSGCLNINPENCVPTFLFSSILGIHMLCETLYFHRDDLSSFLAKFIQYASLHRGVRAIAGTSWSTLQSLHPDQSWQNGSHSASNIGSCRIRRSLLEKIHGAKLGPALTKHYQQAIELLPFQTQAADQPPEIAPCHSVVAWPVLVHAEYLDHLSHGRPEALVILAHYAVLLHHHRQFWVFGDGGRWLIERISDQLGLDWESWLAWPKMAINTD